MDDFERILATATALFIIFMIGLSAVVVHLYGL